MQSASRSHDGIAVNTGRLAAKCVFGYFTGGKERIFLCIGVVAAGLCAKAAVLAAAAAARVDDGAELKTIAAQSAADAIRAFT